MSERCECELPREACERNPHKCDHPYPTFAVTPKPCSDYVEMRTKFLAAAKTAGDKSAEIIELQRALSNLIAAVERNDNSHEMGLSRTDPAVLAARQLLGPGTHDESQCWEPCGELGKSEEHARVVDEPTASSEVSLRVAELRHLRNLLKTGEYMGTDVMLAWIAVAEYADLLEAGNSAHEPFAVGDRVEWRGHKGVVKSGPHFIVEFEKGNSHYLEPTALTKSSSLVQDVCDRAAHLTDLPTPRSTDLRDYGYVPGNYMSDCLTCEEWIMNVDKRCRTCKPCAEKKMQAALAGQRQ